MTRTEFIELTKDLFEEYLPKVSKADRKSFIEAQLGELEDAGLEIEEDYEDDETEEVEELDF